MPVGNVQRAVSANFHIARPEVRVVRIQNWLDFLTGDVGPVVLDFVLGNAQESNGVGNEEVTVDARWEMAAGENPVCRNRRLLKKA